MRTRRSRSRAGSRSSSRRSTGSRDLLAEDSEYADEFAGGTLTHTFLNVNDYHRYHFGVGGEVKETDVLERNVALEVSWDEKEKKYVPLDSTGWQFSQTLGS